MSHFKEKAAVAFGIGLAAFGIGQALHQVEGGSLDTARLRVMHNNCTTVGFSNHDELCNIYTAELVNYAGRAALVSGELILGAIGVGMAISGTRTWHTGRDTNAELSEYAAQGIEELEVFLGARSPQEDK